MTSLDYPRLWKLGLIQINVRKRANHQCEQCGMEFVEGTNLARTALNRLGNPMIGTVHHIDMDKQNCSMNNLVYLCQSCHYKIHLWGWMPGKALPQEWNDNPPQWLIDRNLAYVRQLPLFEGVGS